MAARKDSHDAEQKRCGMTNPKPEALTRRNPNFKHGHTTKDGGRPSKAYRAYIHMLNRCLNPKSNRYSQYGGRGITVCDEWRESFTSFLRDMGEPPSDAHSLDRIDVNSTYEPSNCRWATEKQQQHNRQNNHFLTAFGQTKTLTAWSQQHGVGYTTILHRLSKGWSVEDAVSVPPLGSKRDTDPKS